MFTRLNFANVLLKTLVINSNCTVFGADTGRDDYNGLTSDIFQTILLNVRPLIHYLSNAMYGCPIKLGANVSDHF